MAWYRTGTISLTNGSATVTGSGTSWIANAQIGEALYAPDGRLYEITNIASNTSMTITPAYLGSNVSGQTYVIVPSQSYIRDLAAQAADLVNNYSTIANTIGVGKFPDGTLADPAFKFSDDLDTGFFRSAANEVTFVAGGVAQFKYNASGVSFVTGGDLVGSTATQTLTNKTISADNNTLSGIAASSFVLSNASGNIDGSADQKAIPTGVVVGTTDTQTLTNKTITGGTVNPTTLQEGSSPAVVQSDVGTAPNEIPLNQHLGNLAYQDAGSIAGDVVVGGGITAGDASVISVNSSSNALRITQTGSGNALVVEDSANPDSTPFVIDADGNVRKGILTALSSRFGATVLTPGILNASNNFNSGAIGAFSYNTTPIQAFARSASGTVGTQSLVAVNNDLGFITFAGSDGTDFTEAARISATVDGTPGTNDMPGRLVFSTTADGASSPTERMRIDNQGRVGVGGSPSADTSQFVLRGTNTLGEFSSSIVAAQVFGNGVNGRGDVYQSVPAVNNTTGTVGQVNGFRATQGTFSTAVTSQFGFQAVSTLTGATNNYGFYSNIASGTGRYNFYAAGSAPNYFAGNVLVGKTAQSLGTDGIELRPGGLIAGTANDTHSFYLNRRVGDGAVAIFARGGVDVGSISVTTTATAYNTSSDYRLKDDVQPMSGNIDRLMELKPVNFAWKVDGSRVDGFLAHEAQEVVPESVTGTKDAVDDEGNPEYQAIDQSKLVPLLTAALQDAIKRIEALEAQLGA